MRTRRTLPRVIAATVTLICAVVLAVGTQALASKRLEYSTPFDRFFVNRDAYWGLQQNSSPPQCVAYFHSKFSAYSPKEVPSEKAKLEEQKARELSLEGAVRIRLKDTPTVVELKLQAFFDNFLGLIEFASSAVVDKTDLRFNSTSTKENIVFEASRGKSQRSFQMPRPQPVYLMKRSTESYRLRLPEQLGSLLERVASSQNSSETLVELSQEEFAHCQQEVHSASTEKLDSLFDADTVLSPFLYNNLKELPIFIQNTTL